MRETYFKRTTSSAPLLPTRHSNLIWQLIRREILGRYRGSVLGLGWAVITPILMLLVYTSVFVGIFKLKWPAGETESGIEFAIQLFIGLLVFNLFAETVTRAPNLIAEQPNLVKKVVFPLEILPWVSLGAALFQFSIGAIILLISQSVFRATPTAVGIYGIVYLLCFSPFLLGVMYWLAALGVFIRDIGQIVSVSVTLMLFLSPVFYPISAIPVAFQDLMWLNPLTSVIEGLRSTVLANQPPEWLSVAVFAVASISLMITGFYFFSMTRKFFADVI